MFWRFSFRPGRSVDASLTYDGLPAWVGENHYIDLEVGRYVLTDDNKEFIINVHADWSITVELPKKGNDLDKGHTISSAGFHVNSNTLDSLGVNRLTFKPYGGGLKIYADRDYYHPTENSRYSIYWVH